MIDAEAWARKLEDCYDSAPYDAIVREIQRDALESAAKRCRRSKPTSAGVGPTWTACKNECADLVRELMPSSNGAAWVADMLRELKP